MKAICVGLFANLWPNYHSDRTHDSLEKDTPNRRVVEREGRRVAGVVSSARLASAMSEYPPGPAAELEHRSSPERFRRFVTSFAPHNPVLATQASVAETSSADPARAVGAGFQPTSRRAGNLRPSFVIDLAEQLAALAVVTLGILDRILDHSRSSDDIRSLAGPRPAQTRFANSSAGESAHQKMTVA
jgi:hypothetical protein